MEYYLALDIGGTKISAALFNKNGVIEDGYIHRALSETGRGAQAVYENVRAAVQNVLERFKDSIPKKNIAGIGVGCPGPLDTKKGIIIYAPLMGWRNFPVAQKLQEDFDLPVLVDNDGNLGAFAEVRSPEGKAYKLSNIVYMTVSTGCGGGIIIDGNIYHGRGDGAGEVGHVSINSEGERCPCGNYGCLELYASGTAILSKLKNDFKRGVKSRVFELAQGKTENISAALLNRAACEGDPYALEVYKKEGYYLGVGIANVFNMLDIEAFVLGGGVTKAKQFFHSELEAVFLERCIHKVDSGAIRYSDLNDNVVLYGAYFLIKDFRR